MSSIPPTQPPFQEAGDGKPVSSPTLESIVSGRAWNALPSDDQIRFLVGMAQLLATGHGHILTQPCERVHWRTLVAAGFITFDEADDFVLRLTSHGSILFYTVLGRYLPVEEPQ